jgi:hypothetical protein
MKNDPHFLCRHFVKSDKVPNFGSFFLKKRIEEEIEEREFD